MNVAVPPKMPTFTEAGCVVIFGAASGVVTVSTAALEVALPAELVNTARY